MFCLFRVKRTDRTANSCHPKGTFTSLTLCILDKFSRFFLSSADFFSKSSFSKNSFRNTIRVSNNLNPDQAWHFVGPDLGQNCLQKLSVDNTTRRVNTTQTSTANISTTSLIPLSKQTHVLAPPSFVPCLQTLHQIPVQHEQEDQSSPILPQLCPLLLPSSASESQ